MRVLIVEDGRQRGALAAVRSLGRAGHHVAVAAPKTPLSGWSRWCNDVQRIPDASDARCIGRITRIVRQERYDVVFPVGDAECLMLAASRDHLGAAVGVADHNSVRRALDKVELGVVAERLGIRTPQVLEEIPSPLPAAGVVVKERLHGQENQGGRAPHSAPVLAVTTKEAIAAAAAIEGGGGTPLFQEAVAGDLIAYVACRTKDGHIVGEMQQRALHTFPPQAGVSVRAVSTPVDPALRDACARLLDELGLWGVAEIQFIAPATGTPALIDVNPRFYGSMALAIRAGVDFPVLLTAIATGIEPQARAGRVGARYQWLEGDLRRALVERRGGLSRDIWSCLTFAPRAAHSIFTLKDVNPALRMTWELMTRAPRKAFRRG